MAKRKSFKKTKGSKKKRRSASLLTRFAHPFFDRDFRTFNKAAARAAGGRMQDFVKQFLHAIPKPSRDPRFELSDVITAAEVADIAKSGRVIVQAGGDTGLKEAASGAPTMQELVAAAMTKQFDIAHHTNSPAFFFHLGDVIYGPSKRVDGYKEQFYIPYKTYPGKIVSIAGNHDGDWYPTDKPLEAWLENFSSSKTSEGAKQAGILREMPNQPGVYWMLDAPFVQFIGLYSNKLENPGYISGPKVGQHQRDWLVDALKQIKKERTKDARRSCLPRTIRPIAPADTAEAPKCWPISMPPAPRPASGPTCFGLATPIAISAIREPSKLKKRIGRFRSSSWDVAGTAAKRYPRAEPRPPTSSLSTATKAGAFPDLSSARQKSPRFSTPSMMPVP